MRKIVVFIVLLLAILLIGCTAVTVDKPDGTKVCVTTWGSSQVNDMTYTRDPDRIVLAIGDATNTPEGMDKVIESTGKAIAATTTAGVSSEVDTVITNNDTPDD